jgi:hypothetical protein
VETAKSRSNELIAIAKDLIRVNEVCRRELQTQLELVGKHARKRLRSRRKKNMIAPLRALKAE